VLTVKFSDLPADLSWFRSVLASSIGLGNNPNF
jgi:hypothetical protein